MLFKAATTAHDSSSDKEASDRIDPGIVRICLVEEFQL